MGLFLGKRETDGKWVEGYLYPGIGQHKGKWFITVVDDCLTTSHTYAVISETIREFTGLSDKTGKGIFEGDIVERGDRIWVIEYDNMCAQFVMKTFTDRGVFWIRSFDLIPSEWCEVIGNKFDNPELIKGGEKNGKNDVKGRTRQ